MSIFSSQEQNPKSIEELEKKLYDINNEYKSDITKIIASNKSIKIDNVITQNIIVQDFYLKGNNQNNNNVLNNIKDKIILFNELIDKLETIKKSSKKWETVQPPNALYGKITRPTDNRSKSKYKPNVNNTVQKHIDYLKYLKKILETKLVNDIKIINLFKQVFSNTDEILQLINDISELNKKKKEKQNEENAKQIKEGKQKNLNEKLEKCSIEIKPKLNALSELSNVQYNTELTKYINKEKLDKELKICSKKIEEKLNSLITTLDNINVPNVSKKRGGSNFEITNDIIEKLNLVNVSKSEDYTGNLKNIKQTYEKGLKQNIQQYKEICKALTVYIKDLQQIIKGLLTSFIKEKQKFIEEQRQYLKQKENEIIAINKEINRIINEKIQEKNKKIKEKNKDNNTKIENIYIETIENRELRLELEKIILNEDIWDENKIYALTQTLIGQTNNPLKYNEIKSLVPKIQEQLLEYKKLLEEIYYSSNEKYEKYKNYE